jgi:hypothetical protein
MSQIPLIAEMDDANKVAVHYGFRAMFIKKYGKLSLERSIDFLTQAIEKNPEETLWRFLKGVYLYEVRRIKEVAKKPNRDDIVYMEELLKTERDMGYIVHTAELYREFAKFCRNHQIRSNPNAAEIRALNKKSVMLYK